MAKNRPHSIVYVAICSIQSKSNGILFFLLNFWFTEIGNQAMAYVLTIIWILVMLLLQIHNFITIKQIVYRLKQRKKYIQHPDSTLNPISANDNLKVLRLDSWFWNLGDLFYLCSDQSIVATVVDITNSMQCPFIVVVIVDVFTQWPLNKKHFPLTFNINVEFDFNFESNFYQFTKRTHHKLVFRFFFFNQWLNENWIYIRKNFNAHLTKRKVVKPSHLIEPIYYTSLVRNFLHLIAGGWLHLKVNETKRNKIKWNNIKILEVRDKF